MIVRLILALSVLAGAACLAVFLTVIVAWANVFAAEYGSLLTVLLSGVAAVILFVIGGFAFVIIEAE